MDTTASPIANAPSIPPILRTSGLAIAIIFFAKDLPRAASLSGLGLHQLYWPIIGAISVLAFLSARVFLSPGFYAVSVPDKPSEEKNASSTTSFRPVEIAALGFLAMSFFCVTVTFLNSYVLRIDSGIAAFLCSFLLFGYALACYKRGLRFVESWSIGAGLLFLLLPLPLQAFDLREFQLPINPIEAWLGVQAFSFPYSSLGTIVLASIGGEVFALYEDSAKRNAAPAVPTAAHQPHSDRPVDSPESASQPFIAPAQAIHAPNTQSPVKRQSQEPPKRKRSGFFDDIA